MVVKDQILIYIYYFYDYNNEFDEFRINSNLNSDILFKLNLYIVNPLLWKFQSHRRRKRKKMMNCKKNLRMIIVYNKIMIGR